MVKRTHYPLEAWLDLHMEEIDAERATRMKAHADGCAHCGESSRRAQAWLAAGSAIGRAEKEFDPGPSLWPGLAERLDERIPRKNRLGLFQRRVWLAASVTAALAVALVWVRVEQPQDVSTKVKNISGVGLSALISASDSNPLDWIEIKALRPADAVSESDWMLDWTETYRIYDFDASDLKSSNWTGVVGSGDWDWDLESVDEADLLRMEKALRAWDAFAM